jgi:hypothetical protein
MMNVSLSNVDVTFFSNFVLLGGGRRLCSGVALSKAISGQRTPRREKGASARWSIFTVARVLPEVANFGE